MSAKKRPSNRQIEQGRELARCLFELKLADLDGLGPEERQRWLSEFPLLGPAEFDDVRRQVVEAKMYQQERVGWQSVPHDLAVLVLVLVTTFSSLQVGIVAAVAALVFLESVFQVYFSRRLYRPLSLLVWLTYPAYLWFGYILYRRGLGLLWVILAVALAWAGTFLLGAVARIPMHLFLEARAKGKRPPGPPKWKEDDGKPGP